MIKPKLEPSYLSQTQTVYGSCAGCPPCQLAPIEVSEPVSSPPPETRVEYIPYERTVVQYQEVQRIERVPREVVTTEYEVVKRKGRRPVERLVEDYYTVEYLTEYKAEIISEKRTQMVPRQVIRQSVEYVPYERQIVHYPAEAVRAVASSPLYDSTPDAAYSGLKPSSSGLGPAVTTIGNSGYIPTYQSVGGAYQSGSLTQGVYQQPAYTGEGAYQYSGQQSYLPSMMSSSPEDEYQRVSTGMKATSQTGYYSQSPLLQNSQTATKSILKS